MLSNKKTAESTAPSVRIHDSVASVRHPVHARARSFARRGSQNISVEFASDEQLAEIRPSWIDLLKRSDEPNVFMDPAIVRAAADAYPKSQRATLLAWAAFGERRRLVGVWAFSVGYVRQSILPVHVLTAPPFLHGYAATPVIDRSCGEDALEAMLEAIAAEPRLPKILALEAMATDGPAMQALTRVLESRGGAPRMLERSRRPKLQSGLDGKSYLERALSSATRKKLRQHRRRLSEQGDLTSAIVSEPKAVRTALEHFLQLEACGWKGKQGTALLCSDADAAFTRAAIGTLAEEGRACIHALYLDRRPVSMQIVLRAGHGAFTWKIAYDEKLHRFSPGMLLLEDYTAAFLDDPSIAFVDSCTYDERSFMSAWTEREQIANLWIGARRGGSLAFACLWRLQKAYSVLRATAKRAYLRGRK